MPNQIQLKITERTRFAEGHLFGDTGAYERLVGRAYFNVDPQEPAQEGIVDLDKVSLNNQGLVEFYSDLFILKPISPELGNGRLLFGYGNRGNKRELQFFNDAPASNDPNTIEDAGNGFLMRRGYSVVWAAWEGDLLPGDGRMLLDVPVATENGHPITGLVRSEFIADKNGVTTVPVSGMVSTRCYPVVSQSMGQARLTRRRYPDDERIIISPGDWRFARIESGVGLDGQGMEHTVLPSSTHVYLPSGFESGWIYELVYTASDPVVLGLGHVVVRDLVSFFKYEDRDATNQVNPLGRIEKAYAWGRSQTGRCIRDFLHNGFNCDASNRRVFDGVMPHVSGAGLMWMNHRFANVVSAAGQQYESHCTPADRFPFSYAKTTDHLTGRVDAILKRPETDPLVIHTQTSTEYWQRRGSLVHTDTQGNDLPQPDGVRVYFWSSSQHFADPNSPKSGCAVGQYDSNVVRTSMLFRAMLDTLDRWATEGRPPPPNQIPLRADGTLVTMEDWRAQFPRIPCVALPREPNTLPLMDFGPDFKKGLLTKEPPELVPGKGYVVLVPSVDQDGNDIAGVRAPMVSAPLATYTGWNLRRRGFGAGALYSFIGSTLPFPDSQEERRQTADPRRSVLERYGSAKSYVEAVEQAARVLVADGFMLEEDVQRSVATAANWDSACHDVRL